MQSQQSYTGVTLGGRYVLGDLLGKGGFGAVYKAVQSDLGRTVAVKILHADAVLAGDGLARFAREARAAAALGHPNIAQVSDFQMKPGEPPFIVLEFLEGLTFGAVLRKQPRLDASRVCGVAHQVLSALDVAHKAGITHRDVKPDNIFLVSLPGLDDFVKLLDFGIAKLSSSATTSPLTELGTMLGTPAFMAPEQVANVFVDHRADLYSVGATMYYALSGQHVFDAPNVSALLYAIVHQPVLPLSSIDRRIDPRLSAVVERAMHKDPAARFSSAAEMRAALEPWTLAAPRIGIQPVATTPNPMAMGAGGVGAFGNGGPLTGSPTVERHPTSASGAPPASPTQQTPSFSPSQAPTAGPMALGMGSTGSSPSLGPTACASPSLAQAPAPAGGPSPVAPTLDQPRHSHYGAPPGPSFHPHAMQAVPAHASAMPPASRGLGGIMMLVGGGLALFAVLIAAGIVVYVLHGNDAAASVGPWPWSSSSASAPVASVAPPSTAAPSGGPVAVGPAAPGVVPGKPGVAPPATAPKSPGSPTAPTAPAPTSPAPTSPGSPAPSPTLTAPTIPTAPAGPPGTQRMATKTAQLNFGDCTFEMAECKASLAPLMPAIQQCYAATELDPPNHEVADYVIIMDRDGKVMETSRAKRNNVPHPKLDPCVNTALRRGKYPRGPGPGRIEVLLRARLE